MRKFQKFKTPIKLGFAGTLLAFLISQTDLAFIKALLLTTNLWLFLFAFLIMCARMFVAAFRWKVLLPRETTNVSLLRLAMFYYIGRFFGFFLPTVVGGDLVRGYYLYGDGISKPEVAGSILAERVLGIAAMMVLALLAMACGFNRISNNVIRLLVIVPSVSGLTILWLIYTGNWNLSSGLQSVTKGKLQFVHEIIPIVGSYKRRPGCLFYGFGLSVLFQALGIGATYLIALSLGSPTPLFFFLMFLPIIWLVSMLPVSINGLGIREGSFVLLFTSIGMSKEMALAISTLFLFQLLLMAGLGSLFFICSHKKIEAIRTYQNV